MNIKNIGEFGLIQRIRRKIKLSGNVLVGIGDDTAVLRPLGSSHALLLTVDNVVEGIHFSKGTDERLIGQKALARSLSDIAAMGGNPKYCLVTLGLPKSLSVEAVDRLYDGILKVAKVFKVTLVGGDITRSPKHLFISVTVMGEALKNKFVLRKGAKPGDTLFVTGTLGGSISGKHLCFKPRIREGQWLVKNNIPASMIDVSDGLVGDLRHLLEEGKIGAVIRQAKIPISKAANHLAREGGPSALERALRDGEDYELLFSSRRKDFSWIKDFETTFRIPVTCIGSIIKDSFKIYLEDDHGRKKEISEKGFTHF